ncbi:MAG: cation:proton antiporter [Halobaculum sp.]
MSEAGLLTLLTNVLVVLTVALGVRLLVRNRETLSYASVLVFVGLLVSIAGLSFDIELGPAVILELLLPAIVFQGTTELEVDTLREDLVPVLVLTVVGLPLAVTVLGVVGQAAFTAVGTELPLIAALLFASVILPTDPAAVISLFEEFEIGERLSVLVEGESLFNDGVAIVIFSTLVAAFRGGGVESIASVGGLASAAGEVAVVGGGGAAIGLVVGYLAHRATRTLDDRTSVLLVTVVVAYGSFLAGEFVGVSGVLATVGSGLTMGAHEQTHDSITEVEDFVEEVWGAIATLISTVLYLLIGAEVAVGDFLEHAAIILVAVPLVLVVRGLTVYPLITGTNALTERTIPRNCQHVMVWGGLHTVVPIGLALSLPQGVPFRDAIQAMVFGVAVVGMIGQGLLMPRVLAAVGFGDDESDDENEPGAEAV